jgi:transposase
VRLGSLTIPTDASGYAQLLAWARTLGRIQRFGIEGTGSYGQGLVSYLRRHDIAILEAGRPDRRDRRQRGKTDTIDAENAARAVLAGRAGPTPRRPRGRGDEGTRGRAR